LGTRRSDRQPGDFQSSCGLAGLAGQRAEALAAAAPRSRAEPSGSTQTAAERWPAQAQERLVADFLASPEGQGLTSPVARSLPRDLVMICVNYLGRDPLPPGPLLFRRLVRDVLPASAVLTASALRADICTEATLQRLGSARGKRLKLV
jgi:hypothetical protein